MKLTLPRNKLKASSTQHMFYSISFLPDFFGFHDGIA